MRIIHCFRSPVGGIFRHVRDLIEEHVAQGHEVGILCDSTTGGAHEDRLFEEIMPLLSLGLTRIPIRRSIHPKDFLSLYDSYQTIKDLKPDVIHGHGAKGGVIARIIGSLLRKGSQRVVRIYSPHGGSLHYDANTLKGRFFFLVERMLERMTDAICFVCDYERKTYFEKIAHPLPLYRTIYNGVRDGEFIPVKQDPDARDFLFIGMMRDLKGPQIFIEAISNLVKGSNPNVKAYMIGDGPETERYRTKIDALGISNNIIMHSAMPARQAFAMAKCVVIPSLAEAMPYIVLETVAAGRPIIASAVGGIPEILGEASPGLVPAGDSEALTRTMEAFLSDQQPYRIEDHALERFHEQFSAKAMASQMSSLYMDLHRQ